MRGVAALDKRAAQQRRVAVTQRRVAVAQRRFSSSPDGQPLSSEANVASSAVPSTDFKDKRNSNSN